MSINHIPNDKDVVKIKLLLTKQRFKKLKLLDKSDNVNILLILLQAQTISEWETILMPCLKDQPLSEK